MPSKIGTESTQYKAHLKTLIGDQKVSTAEAKALVKELQVRNPWGQTEVGQDDKDDGVFALPVADFAKAFARVEYVHPSPS